MFPWLWFWSPHLQYPLSGSVEQDYKPFTNWGFFGAIKPEAGDGQIEQKVFDVASYGRQLGLITEVIMDLVNKKAPEWKTVLEELEPLTRLERLEKVKTLEKLKISDPNNPLASLARLKIIQLDVEEIKKLDREAKIDKFETLVKNFQSRQNSEDTIASLRKILDKGDD